MLAEGEISPGVRKGVAVDQYGRIIVGSAGAGAGTGANAAVVNQRVGYVLKKVSASFNRPGDVLPYAIGDAITTSTSAPAIFQLDLSSIVSGVGQSIEIRRLTIETSTKQTVLPIINAFLSPVTFAATNDNEPLSIANTVWEQGIAYLPCDVQSYSAINTSNIYVGPPIPMVLAAADNKLYGALQAANAYTPGNAEKFTINAWIALL